MKIKHPTLKNYNLNHTTLLGPENALYHRGRVTGKFEISLPSYWESMVEETSISVHLTPIGAHQNVIVKRIGDNKIYLQSHGGMPVDCYYFLMAARKDIPRLKTEEMIDKGD